MERTPPTREGEKRQGYGNRYINTDLTNQNFMLVFTRRTTGGREDKRAVTTEVLSNSGNRYVEGIDGEQT